MALLLHPKSILMKKKILIVDNNSNLLEVLELLLKNSYDTISTLNRTQAVDMASEQIPDLILLGIVLPTMEGLEIAHMIREYSKIHYTPILAMTARSNSISEKPCVFSGCDDFIAKPFSYDQLLTQIEKLLDPHSDPYPYPKAVFPHISV